MRPLTLKEAAKNLIRVNSWNSWRFLLATNSTNFTKMITRFCHRFEPGRSSPRSKSLQLIVVKVDSQAGFVGDRQVAFHGAHLLPGDELAQLG